MSRGRFIVDEANISCTFADNDDQAFDGMLGSGRSVETDERAYVDPAEIVSRIRLQLDGSTTELTADVVQGEYV